MRARVLFVAAALIGGCRAAYQPEPLAVDGPDAFEFDHAVLLWCGNEGHVVVSTADKCEGGRYDSAGDLCEEVMRRTGYVEGEGCTRYTVGPRWGDQQPDMFVWASARNPSVYGQSLWQSLWSVQRFSCSMNESGESEVLSTGTAEWGTFLRRTVDGQPAYWVRIDLSERDGVGWRFTIEGTLYLCPGDDPQEQYLGSLEGDDDSGGG